MSSTELRVARDLALPAEAVTQTFAVLAKRGVGKTYLASVMVEEMLKAHLPVVIVDPIGVWWGLRAAADGKGPGLPIVVLGGDHGDVPLESTAGQTIADVVVDEGLSVVLDFSLFRKAEQTRFMTDFAERLYHRNRRALHLVLDEADAYAPQRPMKGQERLLGAIEDLVRRGRARGIGVTLVTQRAAVLNKDVLTQCEVLVTLRTIAPQDREAIDAWVRVHGTPEQREEMMASLPSLPIGTAWFWSPGWLDIFQRAQIRKRETFDSSATPKVGEKVKPPKQLADVDLEALREKIAGTIEKARADDPKELRRRIAELERDLKHRPTETRVETVTERVEVPVVTEDERAALTLLSVQLGGAVSELHTIVEDAVSMVEALTNRLVDVTPNVERTPGGTAYIRSEPKGKILPGPGTVQRSPASRPPATTSEPNVQSSKLGTTELELNKGQRVLLETLARRHPATATVTQLGTLSGYSTKSSSFQQNLREIVRAGLVQQQARELTITDAGLAAVGAETLRPRTPQELLDMWRQALTTGERAVLDLLVENYPDWLTREGISEQTGYSMTSSSFQQNLRDLRKNGLAEESNGAMRASPTLFLESEASL